ncbi:hypothetical protein L195_g046060 [Trifolium pratense]|uniref:Uncharacterized protein n=1 Tax=Trifolium pratense TaxID=57577 RepID=A0A2K3MGL7_TRIPR|nr:hypothetical protein L195_g046060 [Trifolium pratense]
MKMKNEPEAKIEERNDESDGGGNKKKCEFRRKGTAQVPTHGGTENHAMSG